MMGILLEPCQPACDVFRPDANRVEASRVQIDIIDDCPLPYVESSFDDALNLPAYLDLRSIGRSKPAPFE